MRAPLNTLHVAVLMGGLSSEREVSLSSGRGCADALEGQVAKVTRVDAGRDLAQVLTALKPDVAAKFDALENIGVVRLADRDIVRHPLVAEMLSVL